MRYDEKIIIKNYKCFDSKGGGFDRIMPINIIIGKNNSGKSSLIDLVKYVNDPQSIIITNARGSSTATIQLSKKVKEIELNSELRALNTRMDKKHKKLCDQIKKALDTPVEYMLLQNNSRKLFNNNNFNDVNVNTKVETLINTEAIPISGLSFYHITAERNIEQEKAVPLKNVSLKPNGEGATSMIQQFLIIKSTERERSLIEKELLEQLNKIVKPDIEFERILVELDESNNKWEILFEDKSKTSIAISRMGSGIKTILQVLLNLLIKPIIDKKNRDNCVFAFEELENNLHPSLQRRLYNYIKKFCKIHNAYFFITTHSNIVIDTFGNYEDAQIIHVLNDGEKSTTKTIFSNQETKNIIDDLGVKASDLLQSNGIIWVEGPSDRNYINKWINLLKPELIEGTHYSIMFYGGRLLSNLSVNSELIDEKVIPLLKINQNAFVIIDRDGDRITPKLNKTKKRIETETGKDNCWITFGREIENYLDDKIVSDWLNSKYDETYKINFQNNLNKKIEENIRKSTRKKVLEYNKGKTSYSSEIKDLITLQSINIHDLKDNLERLIDRIDGWNK